MNITKKIAVGLALLGSIWFASTANAILLDTSSSGYLGRISEGLPANETNEVTWMNELIGMTINTSMTSAVAAPGPPGSINTVYRSGNSIASLPTASGHNKLDNNGNRIAGGYSYILGKYGAGGTVKESHVWYIGDLASDTELDLKFRNGLSHSTLVGPRTPPPPPPPPPGVPDTGSTLVLLGLGLGFLGFLKRRR